MIYKSFTPYRPGDFSSGCHALDFAKNMTLSALIGLFLTLMLSSVSANDRSPITLLGAFHDPDKETIVFSVHYLRGKDSNEKIVMPVTGVYLKIDGQKYPINSHDTMICGSHTAGRNVIDEYSVRGYKVLGDLEEIPNLRGLESVIFGLDYAVNGKPIKLEKQVSFTVYTEKAEPNAVRPSKAAGSEAEGGQKPKPELKEHSQ